MQKLGERIRHVRGRMSQEAFAGLLGISKGALGGYERGENCPNADVVLTICNKRMSGMFFDFKRCGNLVP